MPEHLLQREIAEPDLVDQRRCLWPEQIGAQRPEREAVGVLTAVGLSRGIVALIDEPEQHCQRLVQVRAVLRVWRGQRDERQIAEPVEAVAALVLGCAGGKDAELGRRFRVEQEEDAVQEAQRLLGQGLCLPGGKRIQLLGLASRARPRWR